MKIISKITILVISWTGVAAACDQVQDKFNAETETVERTTGPTGGEGPIGPSGINGENGQDGVDGMAGKDAEPCTIDIQGGIRFLYCPKQEPIQVDKPEPPIFAGSYCGRIVVFIGDAFYVITGNQLIKLYPGRKVKVGKTCEVTYNNKQNIVKEIMGKDIK